MASRHRTQDERTGHIGSYYHIAFDPQIGYRSVASGTIRVCDDFVGNRDRDNDLVIDEQDIHWIRLNGEWIEDGTLIVGCYDMPCSHMAPQAPSPVSERYGLLDIVELSNLAWKVLASTNPSKPSVSLPTAIGELKDLPSLVRGWGGSLIRRIAQGHLTWRWALRPMLSDLSKLLKFTENSEKKFQELKKLSTGKPVRKRCGLGQDDEEGQFGEVDYPFESVVLPVHGVTKTTFRMRMWGTVSYTLSPGFDFPSWVPSIQGKRHKNDRMRKYAKQLTLGITSYEALATAWELVPWSWLADWFFGFGEVIAACNNTIPVTWGSICVMRTSSAMTEHKVTRIPSWCTPSSPPPCVRIVKERYVAVPVLPFSPSLPLFDRGKWSVLSSLAALSLEKGPRFKR